LKRADVERYIGEIEFLFAQAMKRIWVREHHELRELEVTLPQFAALMAISFKDGCMMRELAEELSLALGTVTGIIDRLVRAGLVKRYRDEKDRRIVRVRLTQVGEELVRNIKEMRRNHYISIFEKMDEEDVRALVESLRKFLLVVVGE